MGRPDPFEEGAAISGVLIDPAKLLHISDCVIGKDIAVLIAVQNGFGRGQRHDTVIRGPASLMIQSEFFTLKVIELKTGTCNIPCNRSNHNRTSFKFCNEMTDHLLCFHYRQRGTD